MLLYQGADYSYLVHPEPERYEDKYALRDLGARFLPHVGLIFIPDDMEKLAYLSKYRESQQSFHCPKDKKRMMLTSLITGDLRDEISELPLWCKKEQY